MVAARREADLTTVAETTRKHKITEPTICAWHKALEQENGQLKKLLAEAALVNAILKEITADKR